MVGNSAYGQKLADNPGVCFAKNILIGKKNKIVMKTEIEILAEEIGCTPGELIIKSTNACICPYQAISAIHAYHAQFEQWISVEERLPEISEDYNVVLDLNDGGNPVSGIMEFYAIEKTWIYPGFGIKCDSVTHWRKLPSPPAKD